MQDREKKYFWLRNPQRGVGQDVTTFNPGQGPEREFRKLVGDVFSHHIPLDDRFPCNPSNLIVPPRFLHEEIEKRDIRCLFHLCHFCPVKLAIGEDGAEITEDEFVSELLAKTNGSPANELRFFIGKVGVGKSSYMCNLIFRRGVEFLEAYNTWNVWFDADLKSLHEVPKYEALLYKLGDTVLHRASEYQFVDADWLRNTEAKLGGHATEAALETAVHSILEDVNHSTGKHILLIVDNLDFIYHQFDRGAFADNWTSEMREGYKTLVKFVKLFAPGGTLASEGLRVVFAMRFDTLQHFKASWTWVPYTDINIDLHAYRIEGPGLQDVVETHIGLLKDVISRMPQTAKKDRFLDGANKLHSNIVDFAQKYGQTLKTMHRLSRQGLRHVVSLFGKYLWLGVSYVAAKDSFEVSRRFIDTPAPMLLLTITDGNRTFSQFASRFPNLYLVRSDYFRSREYALPEELQEDNPHTYWLKRLLLQVLYKKTLSTEARNTDEMLYIFAAGKGKGWYLGSTVRLALGSMAQSNCSNLLDYSLKSGTTSQMEHIESISLTERGLCLVQGQMDTFPYLEHVTDDHLLPLPQNLKNQFADPGFDYSYLVERDYASYDEKKRKMFTTKVVQVLVFLEILKVSLILESQLYDKAFARVKDVLGSLPDMTAAQNAVREAAKNMAWWIRRDEFDRLVPNLSTIGRLAKEQLTPVYIWPGS